MGDDVDVDIEDAVSAMGTDLTSTEDANIIVAPPTKEPSYDSIPALSSYQIKPPLQEKFKGNPIKEIIREVFAEKLAGRTYEVNEARKWTVAIANSVNTKVRGLKMKRYKHIVEVSLGEMKGAGLKSGVRCLWDSESDGYTSETFMNDTMFCLVVVFGIYLY